MLFYLFCFLLLLLLKKSEPVSQPASRPSSATPHRCGPPSSRSGTHRRTALPARTRPAAPSLADGWTPHPSSTPSQTQPRRAHAEADPDRSGAWSDPVHPWDSPLEQKAIGNPSARPPLSFLVCSKPLRRLDLAGGARGRRCSPPVCAAVRACRAAPPAPLDLPLDAALV